VNQTRICSLIEACINVLIGFGINFCANMLILPLIGFHITASQNLFIGMLYTIISVARSYVIRLWFNARLHHAAHTLAGRVA
jgi:hypothetical protein